MNCWNFKVTLGLKLFSQLLLWTSATKLFTKDISLSRIQMKENYSYSMHHMSWFKQSCSAISKIDDKCLPMMWLTDWHGAFSLNWCLWC
jgi:hypothetical protein